MEPQEVINKSAEYLKQFFPNADRIKLEEIEISDDDKYWFVTLSYDDNETVPSGYMTIGKIRFYKTFKIDAEKGIVRSMKIRDNK